MPVDAHGALAGQPGGAASTCVRCGGPRKPRTGGYGMCANCYAKDPERVITWISRRIERLGPGAPGWFGELGFDLAEAGCTQIALRYLHLVEPIVASGVHDPVGVLAVLRARPEPATQAAAVMLAGFFARTGHGPPYSYGPSWDQLRGRHLARLDARLRPAAELYIGHLAAQRQRAEMYGSCALSEVTITDHAKRLARLGVQLASCGVSDWAAVTAGDVEAFLTTDVSGRLATYRAFFAFARRRKLILINPAAGITRRQRKGFAGHLLTVPEQRRLVRRWADPGTDPRERVIGLLCLLHAARSVDLRALTIGQVDLDSGTVRLSRRPWPVQLDPLSLDALRDYLAWRERLGTRNPHLLITKRNRLHQHPCSIMFPERILATAGVTPALLRQTRIADLAHRADAKVVASAIGIHRETALHYLADTVDREAIAFNFDPETNPTDPDPPD